MKNVKAALERVGLKAVAVNVAKKPGLFQQVSAVLSGVERFMCCIALGVGAAYWAVNAEVSDSMRFWEQLVTWVECGGRLIVQGERASMMGKWPEWFGKTWEDDSYRRTTYKCQGSSIVGSHWCKWYHEATGGSYVKHQCCTRDRCGLRSG